jgi:hypothetical protein
MMFKDTVTKHKELWINSYLYSTVGRLDVFRVRLSLGHTSIVYDSIR